MATVHVGRLLGQVGFSRTVAIKRLHPQFAMDPDFCGQFLDEARLVARIRHPNVVPTLDVVAAAGELFIVMDYVDGLSLAQLLRQVRDNRGLVRIPLVATIMTGVLQGLHAAHEAKSDRGAPLGIVHRDVSPHNVIVGVDGVPRVLDFGIAKAAQRAQTTTAGIVKGKLAYMAPEQIMSGQVSRSTDVFAAGIMCWEAITGQRLFAADSEIALVNQVMQAPIMPPSRVGRGIAASLDAVVLRALERDPRKRFATAADMAKAVEDAIGLVSARTVGEWVREIGGDALATRAEMVAQVESESAAESGIEAHAAMRRSFEGVPANISPQTGLAMVSSPPGGAPHAPKMMARHPASLQGPPGLTTNPGVGPHQGVVPPLPMGPGASDSALIVPSVMRSSMESLLATSGSDASTSQFSNLSITPVQGPSLLMQVGMILGAVVTAVILAVTVVYVVHGRSNAVAATRPPASARVAAASSASAPAAAVALTNAHGTPSAASASAGVASAGSAAARASSASSSVATAPVATAAAAAGTAPATAAGAASTTPSSAAPSSAPPSSAPAGTPATPTTPAFGSGSYAPSNVPSTVHSPRPTTSHPHNPQYSRD
jgi:serine/threonine-protein kinase